VTGGDLRLKALGVPVVLVSASDAAAFSRYSVLDGTDIAESRQIQNVWWPSLCATVSAAETQRSEHDLQMTTRGWSTGTVPSPCRPAVNDTRSVPYQPCRWRHGYAYLVLINAAIVLIGNALARQYIERTAAIRGLVIGCMLLAFAQLGFLSAWAPGVR